MVNYLSINETFQHMIFQYYSKCNLLMKINYFCPHNHIHKKYRPKKSQDHSIPGPPLVSLTRRKLMLWSVCVPLTFSLPQFEHPAKEGQNHHVACTERRVLLLGHLLTTLSAFDRGLYWQNTIIPPSLWTRHLQSILIGKPLSPIGQCNLKTTSFY